MFVCCFLDTPCGFAAVEPFGRPLFGFGEDTLLGNALGFISCKRLLLRGGSEVGTGDGSGTSGSGTGGWLSEGSMEAYSFRGRPGLLFLGGDLDTLPGLTGPRTLLAVGRPRRIFGDGALSPCDDLSPAAEPTP